MAIPTYAFYNWNSNVTYSKWDVIYGADPTDTRYFYSTVNNNMGANPTDFYLNVSLSMSRKDNITRVIFAQNSNTIFFQAGSIAAVANTEPDSTINYTGTILAGGSGYIDYLNPGLDTSNIITNGVVIAPIHPYWTTGFAWLPSWTTDVTHEMSVINTKLGEGYSQRMNAAINSNSLSWNLVFEERQDKETMALLNFLQNYGGATPFVLNFPIGNLYNLPNIKYISAPAKHQLTSYGLNTITVPVTQVFDIG